MSTTTTERDATIGDLTPDPENRRQRTDRNVTMIENSLRETGAARSIVIDENGQILAGNGVAMAAPAAGITRLRVIDTDGAEIIAIRRTGLTAAQKRALAIYDNRAGELAAWNFEQLRADKAAGLDLQPFWTADELIDLELDAPPFAPSADPQPRLDQKTAITCPHCGQEFTP